MSENVDDEVARLLCLRIADFVADIDPLLSEIFRRVSHDEYMGFVILQQQIRRVPPRAPNGIAVLDCPRCTCETKVKNHRVYRSEKIVCWQCRRTLLEAA